MKKKKTFHGWSPGGKMLAYCADRDSNNTRKLIDEEFIMIYNLKEV